MTIKARTTNHGRLGGMEELPVGGNRPSLCVAYVILAGTSGWAVKQTSSATSYALGTFSFLLGHSLIGFLHTTHPDPAEIIRKIFRQTSILAEVAPLALITAELYLMKGFAQEIAYLHLASAALPIVAEFAMEEYTQDLMDLAILGNLGSLVYLHVVKETGVWTGGLIALAALNHFVFKRLSCRYDVPRIEIVTIGLSFFTVFAMNCLKG